MTENTKRAHPRRALAQKLRRLLVAEGYRPRLDLSDRQWSTLHFKVEGTQYQLRCAEDDRDFVQLCTGYTLEGTTQDDLTLLRAGNEVQAKYKAVKVFLPASREYLELQLELLLGGHALSPELLGRCLSILGAAGREYCQYVTAEAPQAMA